MRVTLRYNSKHFKDSKTYPWILNFNDKDVKVHHVTSFIGCATKENGDEKGRMTFKGEVEVIKTGDGKLVAYINPERIYADVTK